MKKPTNLTHTLKINNAKALFPSKYTKVREEDFRTKMPNELKKYPKGHRVNRIVAAHEKLFDNANRSKEYIAVRKKRSVDFMEL